MIHENIQITPEIVGLELSNATIFVNNFRSNHTFDPLDVLKGGAGYPDADPMELEVYNIYDEFLNSVLAAFEKRENSYYKIYGRNKNKEFFCSWKYETNAAEKKGE